MASACVYEIQRFSLHDGPGIRTLVFLKGCPLSCWWCSNPESHATEPEIGFYAARCISCGACETACPFNAISVTGENRLFERSYCLRCPDMPCAHACPSHAIRRFGKLMSVLDLIELILRDEVFYRTSGGGVTVSGGEPLLQADFVAELLSECKQKKLHTAVETSGYARWSEFEKLIPVTDLFLFDLKHSAEELHVQWTGVQNNLIMENLKQLAPLSRNTIVRIPVIPGFNSDHGILGEMVGHAVDAGVREVHLLPYHRLGRSKYDALSRPYQADAVTVPSSDEIDALRRLATACGARVTVGG